MKNLPSSETSSLNILQAAKFQGSWEPASSLLFCLSPKERAKARDWGEFSSLNRFPAIKRLISYYRQVFKKNGNKHFVKVLGLVSFSWTGLSHLFIGEKKYSDENHFPVWQFYFSVTWSTWKPPGKSMLHLTSLHVIVWAIRWLICFTRYANMRGTRFVLGVEFHHSMVRSFTIKTEEQSKHSGQWKCSPITCNHCSWVSNGSGLT